MLFRTTQAKSQFLKWELLPPFRDTIIQQKSKSNISVTENQNTESENSTTGFLSSEITIEEHPIKSEYLKYAIANQNPESKLLESNSLLQETNSPHGTDSLLFDKAEISATRRSCSEIAVKERFIKTELLESVIDHSPKLNIHNPVLDPIVLGMSGNSELSIVKIESTVEDSFDNENFLLTERSENEYSEEAERFENEYSEEAERFENEYSEERERCENSEEMEKDENEDENELAIKTVGNTVTQETVIPKPPRIMTTTNQTFFCTRCQFTSNNASVLINHQLTDHKDSSRKPFSSLPEKKKLKTHSTQEATDELSFPCLYCQNSFKVQEELTNHVRINHKWGEATCEICGYSYPSLFALNVHKYQFHKITQFQCKVCKRYLFSQENLDRHTLSQHSISNCEKCGKTFSSKQSCISHLQKCGTEK